MPLSSPISGYEPESAFFSDSVTYNAPKGMPIISPIPGNVSVTSDKTITVTSPEGTYVKFAKVGTPSVTNGSKVNAGSQIGYTGEEKLEFTVYDKSNKKKKVEKFLSDTDLAALSVGGAVAAGPLGKTDKVDSKSNDSDKSKGLDLGITPTEKPIDVKDRAGFRLATGIGLAPFHLTTKAFGLDKGKQAESQNRKENLINEEIERIKKLMK